MVSLPVSRLINVAVAITQPGAVGRNFSNLLILGDSNVISGLERIRDYADLSGVAADFGLSAPEYLAAEVYFEQSPKPQSLSIGRYLRTATAGMLEGAILNATQSAIALFQQITAGSMQLEIDGVNHSLSAMNFSTQTNLNGVASVVTAALSGAGTCTWDGEQFIIKSATTGAGIGASGTITFSGQPIAGETVTVNGIVFTFVASAPDATHVLIGASAQQTAANLNTALVNSISPNVLQASYAISGLVITATFKQPGTAGNAFTLVEAATNVAVSGATLSGGTEPSSVQYASATGSGQDVSALMGLQASQALPLVPGYASESPLQAVAALDAISDAWYGLMFAASVQPSDNDNLAIAAFIEADDVTRMFGITIQNTDVLSSQVNNDLASLLKALHYEQTFTQYCSSNAYAVASIFGRLFTIDFAGQNTMIDVMYKQEPGIAAESLTTNEANVLQSKRCNVYVNYDNGTSILQYGTMAGPVFIDETYGIDAMQNAMQTAVFNVNYTSTTKVPQTDQGTNQFVNALAGVCQQFVNNGFLAPGQWNAAGFGQLVQGQFLKLGYYIFAPSVATQSESDRAARKSVPIQIAGKLAGSQQTVDVLVTVNQ
jgi:hypothetical protein